MASSKLEERLAEALRIVGQDASGRWRYPEPVREYQFDKGCCGHSMRYHPLLRLRHCNVCVAHGIEHPMASTPARRWRFDFAWPELKVAVECDGGTFTGGRHV